MDTSFIQSNVDHWHFQCQKFQFEVCVCKFGFDEAVRRIEPPFIIRNGEKIYKGHMSKFQAFNLYLINNKDLIIAEMKKQKYRSTIVANLKLSINMLRLFKSKFYSKEKNQ